MRPPTPGRHPIVRRAPPEQPVRVMPGERPTEHRRHQQDDRDEDNRGGRGQADARGAARAGRAVTAATATTAADRGHEGHDERACSRVGTARMAPARPRAAPVRGAGAKRLPSSRRRSRTASTITRRALASTSTSTRDASANAVTSEKGSNGRRRPGPLARRSENTCSARSCPTSATWRAIRRADGAHPSTAARSSRRSAPISRGRDASTSAAPKSGRIRPATPASTPPSAALAGDPRPERACARRAMPASPKPSAPGVANAGTPSGNSSTIVIAPAHRAGRRPTHATTPAMPRTIRSR